MSITETEWWTGAEKALADEWESFSGYAGYDTIGEFECVLSALQGNAAYLDEETDQHDFYPSLDGWDDYGVDNIADSEGTIQGFQFTYYGNDDGGLYFAVYLDWKDLTFNRDAEGAQAARSYVEAIENARTRLDSLREEYARKARLHRA